MLAVASNKGYAVHHVDVKSAFLNGQVDADVYMPQPKGFEDPIRRQGPSSAQKLVQIETGSQNMVRNDLDRSSCSGF
jgi:hypothetical protein